MFNISVAAVIDTDLTIQHRTLDINGQGYGYIVSHKNYGRFQYRRYTNCTLSLRGFTSSNIVIEAEDWHMEVKRYDWPCYDYLRISTSMNTSVRICERRQFPVALTLSFADDEIRLNFYTDHLDQEDGFWLMYRGKH